MKKLLFLILLIFSLKPTECSWYELFKEKAQNSFNYLSNNKAVATTIGFAGLSAYLGHKVYSQNQTILQLKNDNQRTKEEGEAFSAYIMSSLEPLLPYGTEFERYNQSLNFRLTTVFSNQTKHEDSLENFIKKHSEASEQIYSTLKELAQVKNTGIRIHTPSNNVLDCYENNLFKYGVYVICPKKQQNHYWCPIKDHLKHN